VTEVSPLPTTTPQKLTAARLSVGFTKEPIIEGVDVELQSGEILVLVGPNGAGKSTLVKALARQLQPLSGTVALNGKDVWQMTPAQFASAVAYVPQALEPAQQMTVEEIVMLGRNPHQPWWQWYGDEKDREAVEKALRATEMLSLRKKYLAELSGGERQRATFATALAQEPSFMLLDEPTSHLDFRHQLELLALLKQMKGQGIGCLIVLHDLNMIARLADRVVLLHGQRNTPDSIAAAGAPDMVLSRENLDRVFAVDVHIFKDPQSGELVYNPTRKQS
jgi:iron complex transport system ATP-binding protein